MSLEDHDAIRVVPRGATRAEASALRRSAKRLVETGWARAIYVSAPSIDRRRMAHLMLTRMDSVATSDTYPLGSPPWVQPPPITFGTFTTRVQAALLGTSQSTVVRLSR